VPLVIDGHATEWSIVGVVDAGPLPTAYTSRETIGRRAATAVVATRLTGVGSQVELIQRVRAALDGAGLRVSSTQLAEENRRVMEDHLLMIVDFLGAMGWVMILVGGMGLASTMSLAVLERTREIGVLRAIGAQQPAILGMVQTEGLVIAIAGWLAAIPLSIPMSVLLAEAFSRVMIRVPVRFVPELGGASAWLALAIAISVVACLWPAVRAMRVTVREALAYE
jgi:putative ABC transport system permease protein